MFHWLRRIFQRLDDDKRQQFFETIDALNAEAGGGEPTATTLALGTLELPSEALAIGDPQFLPSLPLLEVPNITTRKAAISASLWRYPSGTETVTGLTVSLDNSSSGGPRRKIGEIGVAMAKLVLADKAAIDEHWTQIGKDRIGVIPTPPGNDMLRILSKRFGLKTVQVNCVRAEVVGSVSEDLEREIEGYLKSIPKCATFPYMFFRVETNCSFDRVNDFDKAWDFIPIGNADAPLMFVCGTGRGDGVYDVECEFSGEIPCVLSIKFIE